MREDLAVRAARWLLSKYAPDWHCHRNPGKHPLTRMKLNGAVKEALQGYEDYEAKKENG